MSTIIDLIATEQVLANGGLGFLTVTYGGGNVTIDVPQADGFAGELFLASGVVGSDGIELIKVVYNIVSVASVGSGAPYDWEATSTTDASTGNFAGFGHPTPLDTTLSSGNTVTATGDLEVLPTATVNHNYDSFLVGFDTVSGGDTFTGSTIVLSKLEVHLVGGDAERFWTQRNYITERDL